jgi:hypothetical protein
MTPCSIQDIWHSVVGWLISLKGFVRKWSWPKWGICLKGLRKMMKNSCQDSQCPGWDVNRSSPDYKCRQTCYIKYAQYQPCFRQKLQILMIFVFYVGPVCDTMQIQAVLPTFQIHCLHLQVELNYPVTRRSLLYVLSGHWVVTFPCRWRP